MDPKIAQAFSILSGALFPDPERLARASLIKANREQIEANTRKLGFEGDRLRNQNDDTEAFQALMLDPNTMATPEGRARATSRLYGTHDGAKAIQSLPGAATFINPNVFSPADLSNVLIGNGIVTNYANTPQGFAVDQQRQRDNAALVDSRVRDGAALLDRRERDRFGAANQTTLDRARIENEGRLATAGIVDNRARENAALLDQRERDRFAAANQTTLDRQTLADQGALARQESQNKTKLAIEAMPARPGSAGARAGKPPIVGRKLADDIWTAIRDRLDTGPTGVAFDPEARRQLMEHAIGVYQETRNFEEAVQSAVDAANVEPGVDRWGFRLFDTPARIKGVGSGAGVSDVLAPQTGENAPASTPAPAAPASPPRRGVNPATGQVIVQQPDGTWVDEKTGKPVGGS